MDKQSIEKIKQKLQTAKNLVDNNYPEVALDRLVGIKKDIEEWYDRAFVLLMEIKEERKKVKEIAYQQDLIEKELERFRLTGEPK